MKKLLIGIIVAALAGLASIVAPAPALASHDVDHGHWNQPPLVVSQAPSGWDSIIQDAAYYWQDIAFFRGYYPPLPSAGYYDNCSEPQVGRILFCIANPGDSRLFVDGQEKLAVTQTYLYTGEPEPWGHVGAVVIIANGTLTGAERQNTMRHEFGHALGLGHTNKPGSGHSVTSVMNDPAVTPYAASVDQAGIYTWQPDYHPQH